MLMRNKIPKLLLVLLVAHQTILQIVITRVRFPVFIAPIPHVPQRGQDLPLTVKRHNWSPIPSWKPFLFPIQNCVAKEHKNLYRCTISHRLVESEPCLLCGS